MKKKIINDKIAKLEKELEILKAEQSDKCGIKPSETKALIEKYYGHCFSFRGMNQVLLI